MINETWLKHGPQRFTVHEPRDIESLKLSPVALPPAPPTFHKSGST